MAATACGGRLPAVLSHNTGGAGSQGGDSLGPLASAGTVADGGGPSGRNPGLEYWPSPHTACVELDIPPP